MKECKRNALLCRYQANYFREIQYRGAFLNSVEHIYAHNLQNVVKSINLLYNKPYIYSKM